MKGLYNNACPERVYRTFMEDLRCYELGDRCGPYEHPRAVTQQLLEPAVPTLNLTPYTSNQALLRLHQPKSPPGAGVHPQTTTPGDSALQAPLWLMSACPKLEVTKDRGQR